MAERKFAIRLAVEDSDKVRAALKGMGAEGAAALRQLDTAARQAGPGLKVVDNAAKDIRSGFEQFANRVPVIGSALAAIGPAGLVAAGGIGAVALSLGALWEAGNKAIEVLDGINTNAANAGLSAESFQALQLTGIESDVENLAASMMTLEKNTAEAAAGSGKLFGKLKELHPEILQQLTAAKTQEDRWDAVAAAIRNTTDRTEQVQIATAAFGKQGAQLIRILEQQGGTITGLTNRYRELGLIIEEDVVKAADEADRQLDLMHAKMKADWTNAMIGFAPVIVSVTGALTDATGAAGAFLDSMNRIEDRSFSTLSRNIADLKRELDALTTGETQGALNRLLFGDIRETGEDAAQAIRVKIAELNRELQARKREQYRGPEGSGEGVDPAEAAREKAAAEAARAAAEAAREAAANEKAAIALRKELGDWTGVYAERQAELNRLVEAGAISQDMANASLAKLRAELDGSAAAMTKWGAYLEAAKTPAQKQLDLIGELGDAYLDGKIPLETYSDVLRILNEQYQALIATQGAYADGATDAAEAQVEAQRTTRELNLALVTTDAILAQQIETVEDFERVFLQAMFNVARQAIWAASQVKGAGLGDILQAGFGAAVGFVTGGGAAPGGAGGGNANAASGGGSIVTPRVMHTGGIAGDAGVTRMVRASAFNNAPRFHTGSDGFRANEYPAILERGEPVVSRFDAGRIVRALDSGGRGAPQKVEINFHGLAEKPEVRETRKANGDMQIDVIVGKMVNAHIRSGGADKAANERWGVRGVRS